VHPIRVGDSVLSGDRVIVVVQRGGSREPVICALAVPEMIRIRSAKVLGQEQRLHRGAIHVWGTRVK
jgi:hypothetical protein